MLEAGLNAADYPSFWVRSPSYLICSELEYNGDVFRPGNRVESDGLEGVVKMCLLSLISNTSEILVEFADFNDRGWDCNCEDMPGFTHPRKSAFIHYDEPMYNLENKSCSYEDFVDMF